MMRMPTAQHQTFLEPLQEPPSTFHLTKANEHYYADSNRWPHGDEPRSLLLRHCRLRGKGAEPRLNAELGKIQCISVFFPTSFSGKSKEPPVTAVESKPGAASPLLQLKTWEDLASYILPLTPRRDLPPICRAGDRTEPVLLPRPRPTVTPWALWL